MNKIYTMITLCLGMSFMGQAQTFEWVTNDTIETNLATNTTVQLITNQKAIGSNVVTLGIEVIHNDLPNYWDGMLCIYGSCLGTIPGVGTTAEMWPISGDTLGMVRLTVNPLDGQEQAKLQVYVFDINHPNDGDTATFLLNTTVGTEELSPLERSLSIYPNPVVNELSFKVDAEVKSAQILDLAGKQVKVWSKDEVTSTLQVGDLPKGTYFVRLEDQQGNVATKQFMKQ